MQHARLAAFLILAVAFQEATFAQSTSVFGFLGNDAGARAAALAGSFVSVAGDVNGLFYNPASLATLDSTQGSAGFFKHLLDINAGYLSYGRRISDDGAIGAGIIYTNYGSFDERDDLGNTIGSFTPADLALILGYATTIDENLYAGAGFKFIHSSIAEYHSTAIAADAGVLYLIPEHRIALGASIRNIGTQLSTYAGVHEQLPLDLTIGGSIIPRGLPLLFNINFHKLNAFADNFGGHFRAFTVGGEFTLSRVLQLRVGYNNEQRLDLKTGTTAGMAGLSISLGITVSRYKVDYALSSLGTIGNFHRISLSSGF